MRIIEIIKSKSQLPISCTTSQQSLLLCFSVLLLAAMSADRLGRQGVSGNYFL